MPKPYKPRVPSSIKDAQTQLVDACGGADKAAVLCRVGRATLHKYTDPDGDHEIVHMPLDVAHALEAHCRRPIVSTFLAHELGFKLVALDAPAVGDMLTTMAHAAKESSDVFAEITEDLKDGHLSANEAGRIIREADEAMAAMQAVADVARPFRDGKGED